MNLYGLLLGVLGTWRLTHLLQAEDGPADLVVRLRKKAGEGFWGKVLDCFQCLSLWIALPLAGYLGKSYGERGLLWLALSGGAILLEHLNHPQTSPPHPLTLKMRRKTMSCCGSRRSLATKVRDEAVWSEFEYIGRSALTIFGSSTGIRYRFDHPGARLPVNAHDAFAFESVPSLRRRLNR